jgi:hypothetical protein
VLFRVLASELRAGWLLCQLKQVLAEAAADPIRTSGAASSAGAVINAARRLSRHFMCISLVSFSSTAGTWWPSALTRH